MHDKLVHLETYLREHAPLLIAYSGGVDSAFLLSVAHGTLGKLALGVIADSPSLPRQSLTDALQLARDIGAQVEIIETREMADERYVSNPANRCYFCKAELFSKLEQMARARAFAAIAYGENADDAHQLRPGRKAAAEFAVIAPLAFAGLTKAEIRQLSRERSLPTADAPAQPCLSSRISHGTRVTAEALQMIEQGENFVRDLGFRVFRVRHLVDGMGNVRARVQIAPEEMYRLARVADRVREGLNAAGYHAVEFDPEGYRAPAMVYEQG
jgi:uncharacterized protein